MFDSYIKWQWYVFPRDRRHYKIRLHKTEKVWVELTAITSELSTSYLLLVVVNCSFMWEAGGSHLMKKVKSL